MKLQTSLFVVVFGGVIAASLAACGSAGEASGSGDPSSGSEANAVATSEQYLVTRVDVEVGHSVTFYEPTPGGLMLVESKLDGQKSVIARQGEVDALALFERLRPGQEAPTALRDAYQRARDAALAAPASDRSITLSKAGGGQTWAPVSAAAASSNGVGVAQEALTSSSNPDNFVDTDGGCDWGSRFSACRIHWGGGFFATATSSSASCIVDHYAGNGITVQLTAGSTVVSFSQSVGTSQLYSWGFVSGSITRRIDILNASGDAFHAGCHFTI
jgi:hypothetical protein